MPGEFALVLDDYHLLDAPPIDEALTFLLEHLPTQMHLVMTTRQDPLLPLPRLRVRGWLTEVRAADLRFTAEETAVFSPYFLSSCNPIKPGTDCQIMMFNFLYPKNAQESGTWIRWKE